jgi:hypothetical protein
MLNPIASHLSGFYKELDIPVLAGELDKEFKKSLEKQPNQNIKCTIYANEFTQEGLVIQR